MKGRAIRQRRYGPPAVMELEEVELAPLAPSEVRFAVIAAAVNRADVEIRSGKWPVMRDDPWPYTPGLEALGDVVEVGAAVTRVAPGDRVITMMQKLGGIWGVRPGGYQSHVTVEEGVCAVVARDVDPFAVAALGLAAVTAWHGLERLALRRGARVVIHGASGGVGSAAVSMARALGAVPIATSSGSGKDDYLRELGAAEIVHLDRGGDALLAALGARSADAVLEVTGAATFRQSVAVLRRGGRLCCVGALTGEDLGLSAWDLLQDLVLTGWSSENLDGDGLRASIERIVAWLRSGELRAPAAVQLPLADAAEAHRRLEANEVRGRLLLIP